MQGIVFDIQKFALHDGPGIRTVIFLKGCPLRCAWCCNPESMNPKPQLGYDDTRCNHCMLCVDHCSSGALGSLNGLLTVNFELCNSCRKCVAECPKSALKIFGWETSTAGLMHEVMKDEAYYKNSGGGLTLSGGDPLYQFDFAFELLQRAKSNGLNTCLETEGFGKTSQFEKLLNNVDYFYFDYKITDPFLHKNYTGVSNSIVLQNLDLLGRSDANIILRCIIIPGINDNDEHFKGIAELSNKYSSIRAVELMPYHNFGTIKYKQSGHLNNQVDSATVKPGISEKWLSRLGELGCRNVRRG